MPKRHGAESNCLFPFHLYFSSPLHFITLSARLFDFQIDRALTITRAYTQWEGRCVSLCTYDFQVIGYWPRQSVLRLGMAPRCKQEYSRAPGLVDLLYLYSCSQRGTVPPLSILHIGLFSIFQITAQYHHPLGLLVIRLTPACPTFVSGSYGRSLSSIEDYYRKSRRDYPLFQIAALNSETGWVLPSGIIEVCPCNQ